ncbi:MAG: HAMP domain-containing sensor histidine kinase [Planctomycetaceae bacterium]
MGRCELADLWRVAWQHVMQAAPLAKVTLEEQIDVANLQCSADRFRIEQVFRNVLENAVAVSSPGSRVTIHCEEAAISEMPGLRITVTDQGPGMTTEQSSRVFEPFFTTKQKGTGLGMPISQRIVEAHGGTIRVSSNLPTGATIEIVLPRTPPTP